MWYVNTFRFGAWTTSLFSQGSIFYVSKRFHRRISIWTPIFKLCKIVVLKIDVWWSENFVYSKSLGNVLVRLRMRRKDVSHAIWRGKPSLIHAYQEHIHKQRVQSNDNSRRNDQSTNLFCKVTVVNLSSSGTQCWSCKLQDNMAMMASGTSGNPNAYDDHALLDDDFLNDGMDAVW